jgi:lysozyme
MPSSNSPMKTSDDGRRLITLREGYRLVAYQDTSPKKIWTIGVGHTSAAGPPEVRMGLVLSKLEIDAILTRDLAVFEKYVNDAVKVPLAQHSFDACVSLAFNIGGPAFATSTVVKRLNSGDFKGAGDAFLMWKKPAALLKRRQAERAQFLGA